jgi:hypothetical protein
VTIFGVEEQDKPETNVKQIAMWDPRRLHACYKECFTFICHVIEHNLSSLAVLGWPNAGLDNVGSLTSRNSIGLHCVLLGQLYFYLNGRLERLLRGGGHMCDTWIFMV